MSFPFGGGSAFQKVNLAQKPFSNVRPRRRLSSALWTLAAVATLWNLFLFAQYWRGSSNGREDLRAVRAQIDERVASVRALQSELGAADLRSQNEHVRFLNRKIAERTFPWSRLFDDLATVLPRNVRLQSLAPSIPESKSRRGEQVDGPIEWIYLGVDGTAKTSEDVLELLDGMFASEVFSSPVLSSERESDGEVDFDVRVRYRIESTPEILEAAGTALQLTDADATSAETLADGAQSSASGESSALPTVATGSSQTEAAQDGTSPGTPDAPIATSTPTTAAARPSATVTGEPSRSAIAASQPRTPQETAPEPRTAPPTAEPQAPAAQESQRGALAGRSPGVGAVPRQPVVQPTATPGQVQAPAAGQDPRRGQRSESGRRVISSDDLPPRTRETANERMGRDRDVAPRVDNASQGRGRGR